MRRRVTGITKRLISEGVPVEFSLAQLMERMLGVVAIIVQVLGRVVVFKGMIQFLLVQVTQWMMTTWSIMMVG